LKLARPSAFRVIRCLLCAWTLATALGGGTAALAQEGAAAAQIEPEKAAAIRRLLRVTGASELMVTSIETSMPAQKAANPQIPEVFWEEFAARLRADVDGFIELLVPLYDKYLTLDEIRQLIDFYESPLGRRLVEVQPTLAAESMLAGQQWGARLGMEVAADLAARGIIIPPE
jgi:hypothetical protein